MDIDPQTVKQTAPGLLGAIGAIFFLQGPWLIRIGMVLPGGALSYYGSSYVAAVSGMPEGLSGFVVGLLGMIFIAKIINTWQALELGQIIGSLLRKWFGVQEK